MTQVLRTIGSAHTDDHRAELLVRKCETLGALEVCGFLRIRGAIDRSPERRKTRDHDCQYNDLAGHRAMRARCVKGSSGSLNSPSTNRTARPMPGGRAIWSASA